MIAICRLFNDMVAEQSLTAFAVKFILNSVGWMFFR
jgi:hypothetical protein